VTVGDSIIIDMSAPADTDAAVTECLTSDIFSMLLCGVSDCIIVFSIVLAPKSL